MKPFIRRWKFNP